MEKIERPTALKSLGWRLGPTTSAGILVLPTRAPFNAAAPPDLSQLTGEELRELALQIATMYGQRPANELVYGLAQRQLFQTNEKEARTAQGHLQEAFIDEACRFLPHITAWQEQNKEGEAWDFGFAAYLKPIGKDGAQLSKHIQQIAGRCDRTDTLSSFRRFLRLDHSPDGELVLVAPWSEVLIRALWNDQVRFVLNRPRHPMRVQGVSVGGHSYSQVNKPTSAISWSFAAPVEIDGQAYAQASGLVRCVSRSVGLLPQGDRPHQQQIPLDKRHGPPHTPFMLRLVNDANYALDLRAAKMLVLFESCLGNHLYRVKLQHLVNLLHPDKRTWKRHADQTAEALRSLRRLALVLPNDKEVQLYDIAYPHGTKPLTRDSEIDIARTRTYLLAHQEGWFESLRGWFTLNVSGAMGIDGRNARDFRLYILACSMWTDSSKPGTWTFDPTYLPRYDLNELSALTNSVSDAVADSMRQNGKEIPVQLHRDRKRIQQAMERLEGHELVKLEYKGRSNKRLILLPPKDWLEARHQLATVGPRPLEPNDE